MSIVLYSINFLVGVDFHIAQILLFSLGTGSNDIDFRMHIVSLPFHLDIHIRAI